jgi:glycine/D-amino acid oxidase-like deaminating enzyme
VLIQNGAVSGLRTNQGIIECEHFVNAAGYWARRIGTLSEKRIQVPLHAAEHYFLHTKPVAELPPTHPVVRDLDGHIYLRENEGRFLAGGFEPVAKPAFEVAARRNYYLSSNHLNAALLFSGWNACSFTDEGNGCGLGPFPRSSRKSSQSRSRHGRCCAREADQWVTKGSSRWSKLEMIGIFMVYV